MNTYQPNLNEAIDACRPGGKDLSLVEMRELSHRLEQDTETRRIYDRCQQLDAAIAQAIHEVDVPADLCANLLVRASETLTASTHESSNNSKSTDFVTRQPSRFLSKWFAVGGTIAACLVVAVVGASILIPAPAVSLKQLEADVQGWVDQLQQNPWSADMESAPEHSVGRYVVTRATGWQELNTAYDSRTIVYDLRDNSGSSLASLIVIDSRRQFNVDLAMPSSPSSTTGGYAIGACKKGSQLFILVVEGGKRRYQQFVRPVPPVM